METLAGETSIPLSVITEPSDPEALAAAFGIGAAGASLVRPDGFVAWRTSTPAEDPAATLREVLGRVLAL